MKVLLILEDPVNDQFIAKPIVEALIPGARVEVLTNPRLRGWAQALDADTLRGIVAGRPMFDRYLLLLDRDCDSTRQGKLDARTDEHARVAGCLAIEELEVWMLAIHQDKLGGVGFSEVRQECHPKERFASPVLAEHGAGPGGGRKYLMRALSGNLSTLLSRCPELKQLQGVLQSGP